MTQRHTGFGVETTYGTAVAPGANEFVETLETVEFEEEQESEEITTINSHSIRAVILSRKKTTGQMTMIGHYQEPVGLLLKQLFGDSDVAGVGPYTHTFPPAAGLPVNGRAGKSLTVEVLEDVFGGTTLCSRWAGTKVTSFNLQVESGTSPRMQWEFIGKSEATAIVPATATYPDFDVMLYKHLTVQFDAVALDGESADLTISRDVGEPYGFGSDEFVKEPRDKGALLVALNLSLYFEDLVQYTKFKAQANIDVSMVLTDGTQSLTVNINKARTRRFSKPIDGQDRIMAQVELTGFFDTTATESAQLVLVNDDVVIP